MQSNLDQTEVPSDLRYLSDLAMGAWKAQLLSSSIQLKVYTILSQKQLSLDELIKQIPMKCRKPQDFYDGLVALKTLVKDSNGLYQNSELANKYLNEDNEREYGGIWLQRMGQIQQSPWLDFTKNIQEGIQPKLHDYSTIYKDKVGFTEQFSQLMNGLSLPARMQLPDLTLWSQYHSFVDIGGSQGHVSVSICQKHEHLTAIVADRPEIQEVCEKYKVLHNMSHQIQFLSLDFLQDQFPSTDVVILGHIIMDWGHHIKVELLRKAYASLNQGGALIIYDWFIDDERKQKISAILMNLHMQMLTNGESFTYKDCQNWMEDVGFKGIQVIALSENIDAMIGYKI